MQVGSFYEAYEDENAIGSARQLSLLLNIHLTKKNGKLPVSQANPYMCGFPIYTLQKHLTKLNDDGYEVVVYDQEEHNPKSRKLRGVYTSSIRMDFEDEESTTEDRHMYALMVQSYPVRSSSNQRVPIVRYMISYIILEMNTGKISMFESDYDHWERVVDDFLLTFQPHELLVSTNLEDHVLERLASSVTLHMDHLPWIPQGSLFHKAFDVPQDEDVIVHLSLDRHPFLVELLGRLLRFVHEHDSLHVQRLHKPEFVEATHRMRWNHDALRELNILSICDKRRSFVDKHKQKSLFDILSQRMNVMGKRYFEKILKSPLQTSHEIRHRYRFIDMIQTHGDKEYTLPTLVDMPWYVLRWSRHTLSIRLLGNLLKSFKVVQEELVPRWKFMFHSVEESLGKALDEIENEWDIDKMMVDDPSFLRQESARMITIRHEIQHLEQQLSEFEILGAKLSVETDKYCLQLTHKVWSQWKKHPQKHDWYVLHETKSSVKISCPSMHCLSSSLLDKKREIMEMTKEAYLSSSSTFLQTYRTVFDTVSDLVSEFSCYVPLSLFFQEYGYIKPDCQDKEESFLHCKELRHPIMERIHSDTLFVPYDCDINRGKGGPHGYLMYGMNSSGKSTLLKSVGLCIWLAQCGLYVPAKEMSYSPFDALYTKIGIQDNLFLGHSTFVAEMNELHYILKRSTSKSFVMCDELTSGTETKSATGIVVSTLLHFLDKKMCFLFTTHLHTVSKIPEITQDSRIRICHFKVDTKCKDLLIQDIKLRYDRRLYDGSGDEEYGIEIAKAVGLPTTFLDVAKKYRDRIQLSVASKSQTSKKSRYNSKFILTECALCSSTERLHTHHITPQKEFRTDHTIHRKNGLYNLVALCESCHESLHHTPALGNAS